MFGRSSAEAAFKPGFQKYERVKINVRRFIVSIVSRLSLPNQLSIQKLLTGCWLFPDFDWLRLKLFVEKVSGHFEQRLGRVFLGVTESMPPADDFINRAWHAGLD